MYFLLFNLMCEDLFKLCFCGLMFDETESTTCSNLIL